MIQDMERKGIVSLCLVLFVIYYCKLFLLNNDHIYCVSFLGGM